MAGAQIPTSVSIIDNLKGYMALSLTEYNTSAAAAIAAGSVVELAGAFFTFASDETPTGWSSVVTATTGYIALTASGTAGSQVVNANYTSTAPTWRDDLQGWYASAASSVRIVASVYKAEATSYYPKYVLAEYQKSKILDSLSVSGQVSISGTVSITSSLSVDGTITHGGIKVTNYIDSTSITRGSVFTVLSTYVPTTGDSILVNGLEGANYVAWNRATRTSSTEITLYGVDYDAMALSSFVLSSGSVVPFARLSLAW